MSFYLESSFSVGLAFIIFLMISWRYLGPPLIQYLDQEIAYIRTSREFNQTALIATQQAYQEAQQRLLTVDQEIAYIQKRMGEDIEALRADFTKKLKFILAAKERAFLAKSKHLYQEGYRNLQQALATLVLDLFIETLQKNEKLQWLEGYTTFSLESLTSFLNAPLSSPPK